MVLNVVGSNPTSHPKKSLIIKRLLRIFFFIWLSCYSGILTKTPRKQLIRQMRNWNIKLGSCPSLKQYDVLFNGKRRFVHRKTSWFLPKAIGNENATRVAGCKLRVAPGILPTAYCKGDFYPKRNPQPFWCFCFFLPYRCNPMGGFFFLFFIYNM